MEPMGAFSSAEWDPIGMLFSNEDLDFAQRLLGGHHPNSANHYQIPEMCDDHTMFIGSSLFTPTNPPPIPEMCDDHNCSSFQESSYYSNGNDNMAFSGFYVPITSSNVDQYNCYYDPIQAVTNQVLVQQMEEDNKLEPDSFLSDYNSGIVISDNGLDQIQPPVVEDQAVDHVPAATGKSRSKRKAKSEAAISDLSTVEEEDGSNGKSKNPKKKPRVSRDKSKKNTQPRKKQKAKSDLNEVENMSNAKEAQISTICSSEDDTISQELNGESASALNSDGKPRANRGAATDPQSLYARKRRERINERLKTLQNLVPNGTKVDISTMLEEAVHYVKFLQLQIKLLSSDDMWMYAPIAYNGMDIGLNQMLHQRL